MLNRYFKVDYNNSLDFMYANMAVKNIYFALISLDYIFDPDKYNVGVYHDEHAYYFFSHSKSPDCMWKHIERIL